MLAAALSLIDLAESVQAVAHCEVWKFYALAIALDANFIATEAFSLFASAAVARATARATLARSSRSRCPRQQLLDGAHIADNAIMAGACIVAGVRFRGS
jgi:hypothetical protein